MRRFFEASYACVVPELALLDDFRAIDIFAGKFLFLKLVSFRRAVSRSSTLPVIQRSSPQYLHAKNDSEILQRISYPALIPTLVWNTFTISRHAPRDRSHCNALLRDIEAKS